MQLKKTLKRLALMASVLIIAACSSGQHGVTDANSDGGFLDGGSAMSGNDSTALDQQAREQLEKLQQNNTVYFGLDKYNIQTDFTSMLDEHAIFLRDHPEISVTIEGYTDERGTPEYNIALGERRANAVKMYLQGRGVPGGQISIISYGKERPAVLGYSEEAFAKNRRAILVY